MKDNTLDKSDIGKKFKKIGCCENLFFLLLGITSKDRCLGENENGTEVSYLNNAFIIFEEPKQKKRIESAPAVVEIINAHSHVGNKKFYQITDSFFDSEESAKNYLSNNHIFYFEKWPASFDKEKGVWFYEWEE